MKSKIKVIISMLFCFMMLSSTVYAEQKDLIEVTKEYKPEMVVLPGDSWSDSFTLTNKTDTTVRVKLDNVEAIENSELQDILDFTLSGDTYKDLSSIKTDWFELEKNESKVFDLGIHFPKDAKNECQGKVFKAKVSFACEAPEGGIINQNGDIVQTGDETNLIGLSILCSISLSVILLVFLFKRKGVFKH